MATDGRLPTRPAIADRESLDSFLERLATANDLSPPHLLRALAATEPSGTPTAAFMMIKPDPLIVARIARLSGADELSIAQATLLRFGDGLPLHLGQLDPLRRHTFRKVVAQGWFPQFGSQACPMCLREEGFWRLEWRLPLVATCRNHDVFLVTHCAGCGRRFRTHRHTLLRPYVGPSQLCGNPIGLRNPCQHSVLGHVAESASPAVLHAAMVLGDALAGASVSMLGKPADPRHFLAEIRHLATLLLHLLCQPQGPALREWAKGIHTEAAFRTTDRRRPRWGISPPRSAAVRGHVLTEAGEILRQPCIQDAAAHLAPWLGLIADLDNGPSAWLVNRTTRTPTMERLINVAVSQHHHVGRRLNQLRPSELLRPCAVPQLIGIDIYTEFFDEMLGGYEWTGRLYVSLSIVRAVADVANWSDAAALIGLDPSFGTRNARASSARLRVSPQTFTEAVESAAHLIPRANNFRAREARVRALARNPSNWFEPWRTTMSPARRRTSLPYAITWMWCEVAQGLLDTSPAWPSPPSHRVRQRYRVFRDSLPRSTQAALRSFVLDYRQPTTVLDDS